MIEIKKLHKSYPIGKDSLHVLKGIDLHIKEGEFVSIMGSSGSGKSTLLNIVGLLDEHDEGDYYLNGQLIKNLNEKKAAILRNKFLGFVFQSFNLISYKTALENVALPLYYKGVPRKERLGVFSITWSLPLTEAQRNIDISLPSIEGNHGQERNLYVRDSDDSQINLLSKSHIQLPVSKLAKVFRSFVSSKSTFYHLAQEHHFKISLLI